MMAVAGCLKSIEDCCCLFIFDWEFFDFLNDRASLYNDARSSNCVFRLAFSHYFDTYQQKMLIIVMDFMLAMFDIFALIDLLLQFSLYTLSDCKFFTSHRDAFHYDSFSIIFPFVHTYLHISSPVPISLS